MPHVNSNFVEVSLNKFFFLFQLLICDVAYDPKTTSLVSELDSFVSHGHIQIL